MPEFRKNGLVYIPQYDKARLIGKVVETEDDPSDRDEHIAPSSGITVRYADGFEEKILITDNVFPIELDEIKALVQQAEKLSRE
jgi:hypothetical protein